MKGGERKEDFFQKNVSRPSNPTDELAQNVSNKNPFRTNYSSIYSSNVPNLTVFSIIYMVQIRFFGPGELNQKGVRRAQYCSTKETIDFVLRIVATFARFCSFLILTSSSRTCSSTLKFSRISVFSLLCCFQLIRRQILHFSNIQCCPALNRRFRFRSVVPILHHRISHGTLKVALRPSGVLLVLLPRSMLLKVCLALPITIILFLARCHLPMAVGHPSFRFPTKK